MSKIDFKGINAALLERAEYFIRQWLPNGVKEGNEWRCGSVKGDKGRSFAVNMNSGMWGDFSTDERGGDLIGLYAAIHGMTDAEAARSLSGTVGGEVHENKRIHKSVKDEPDIIETIPHGTAAPNLTAKGKLTKQHTYRNADGEAIALIQRYDREDGGKEIVPWRYIKGKLVAKHLPRPRPLYNLQELVKHPHKPVMITEGEKCSDVGRAFFTAYVNTTWSGGSANAKHADWSPLAGRDHVLIIPDADKAGWQAAIDIGDLLRDKYGVTGVFVVDTMEKPEGWDIADVADQGESIQSLTMFIKAKKVPFDIFKQMFERPDVDMSPEDALPPPMDADPIGDPVDDGLVVFSDHDILRNPHFRFLGINGPKFFFYKYRTSQIICFGSEELGKEGSLVMLADKEFWDSPEYFGGKYMLARNTLVRLSEQFRFDPRMVRKIGIWQDDAGDVIHLGDKMMTSKGIVPISKFKSKHIYEYCGKSIRLPGYVPPLPVEEARKLIQICAGSNWSDPTAPRILAGWMFTSLICASIRWRSHLYVIGPAGSGKTWLIDNVVSKVLGDFRFKAVGSSTEASIRQGLESNMIPVIFDEAEAEDANAGQRRKGIFELARQAASSDEDSAIVKGGTGGITKEYFVRSPFLFASINTSMEYADESRTTFLYLKPITKSPEVRSTFRSLDNMATQVLTPHFRAALLSRALYLLPRILESYEVFADAAYEVMAQDARHAEQMAFMIVGSWYLEHDHDPTETEARTYVKNMAYLGIQRRTTLTTEERLISAIAQSVVKYRLSNGVVEERIIGELIRTAYSEGSGTANDVLRRYGMMVRGSRLFICNDAENLKRALSRTPFYSGWSNVITNVMGAKDEGEQFFVTGVNGPTISIPLKTLIGQVNAEKDVNSVDNVL